MFSTRLISGNKHRLCYLQARDERGEVAWYFILLHPAKLSAFNKLTENSSYDIADYGQILDSGYGVTAPREVLESMNKKYDCDFN